MEELKSLLEIAEDDAEYYVDNIMLTARKIDVDIQWYFDEVIKQMKKLIQENLNDWR